MKLFGESLDDRFVEKESVSSQVLQFKIEGKKKLEKRLRFIVGKEIEMIEDSMVEYKMSKDKSGYYESISYEERKRIFKNNAYKHPMKVDYGMILFMHHYENRLDYQREQIVDNMLNGGTEFFSTAVQMDENQIRIYGEPNLEWSDGEGGYRCYNYNFDITKDVLGLQGLSGGEHTIHDVYRKCPELVNKLFGRPYRLMPKKMKKGAEQVRIILPTDDKIWPIVFQYDNGVKLMTMEDEAGMRGAMYCPPIPF